MKTTNKIHKLRVLVFIFMLTTVSFCFTDIIEKTKCIKDVKAELKAMTPEERRLAAKQIVVKQDGVKYENTFIPKTNNSGFKVMTVRLTVYWAKGGGTDYYSSKKKSSTGYTLKQGESIAVDPNIIPYKKEVIIPNVGIVKAVDTGTAVRQKRASHGKLPVIDIFFEYKKDAMVFANRYPKVVKVAVLN